MSKPITAPNHVEAQDWPVPALDEPHPIDLDLAGHVQRTLLRYFGDRRAEAEIIEPTFGSAVDALADFVLSGGKRIRPTFAWWGWRAAGGELADAPAVLSAVSALELIQACALVHDDLMDASAVRRGRPTVHVAFATQHREESWLGTPERFGLAAAVLLGDVALAWSDDMLHESGLDRVQLRRALPAWRGMRTEMLAGQYLDVLTQARGDESTWAALRIDRLKTAAYTVERPLHMGASIAGASDELTAALRLFGADLGVAFQLRDDLLGVFGDPEVTGKPAGDDLREGKRTVLVALGLEHAEQRRKPAAAKALRGALGRADMDEDTVDEVRAVLVEIGAVDAVERRIADLTESALDALRSATMDESAATRLAELAITTTRRSC